MRKDGLLGAVGRRKRPWCSDWWDECLKLIFFLGSGLRSCPIHIFTKSALPDPVLLISHEGDRQNQAGDLVMTSDVKIEDKFLFS